MLESLCRHYLENADCPPEVMGRPVRITCSDYALARFLADHIGKAGTSVSVVNEKTEIVPKGITEATPLVAITDAYSLDMHNMALATMREGSLGRMNPDGTPHVPSYTKSEESSRPSKSQPGKFHSQVKKSHLVPAGIHFCSNATCGRIGSLDSTAVGVPKLKKCSRCQGPQYCSKTCQVQHWKGGHKRECKECKPVASSSGNGDGDGAVGGDDGGGSDKSNSGTKSKSSGKGKSKKKGAA